MLGSGRRYWEGGRNIGQVDISSLLTNVKYSGLVSVFDFDLCVERAVRKLPETEYLYEFAFGVGPVVTVLRAQP